MADNKNSKKHSDLHNNRRYGMKKLYSMDMSQEEKKKTEKILKDAFDNIGKPYSERKRRETDEVTISSNPFKVLADFVYTTDFDEIIDEVYQEIYDEAQSNKTISAEAEKELIIRKLKSNNRLKQIYKTRFNKYESDKSWKGMGDLFFDYTAAVYSKKSRVKLLNETKIIKYEALVHGLSKGKDGEKGKSISKLEIKLLQLFLEKHPEYEKEILINEQDRRKDNKNETVKKTSDILEEFAIYRDKQLEQIKANKGPTDKLVFDIRQLVNLYRIDEVEAKKNPNHFKKVKEPALREATKIVYVKNNKEETLNALESHYVVKNYLGGPDFLSKSYSEQMSAIKKTFEKEYISKYFTSSELFYSDIKEELQEKLKSMLENSDITDEERIALNAFLTNDNILLLILDNDMINLELRKSPPFNKYDDAKTISIYKSLNNTVHGHIEKNNYDFQDKLLSSLKTDNDFIENLFDKEIDSAVSTLGYQKHLQTDNSGTQDNNFLNVDFEKDNVKKMQYDYAQDTVAVIHRSEKELKKLVAIIFKDIAAWNKDGKINYLNMPLNELLPLIIDAGKKDSKNNVFIDLNKSLSMSGYLDMLTDWSKDLNSKDNTAKQDEDMRPADLKERFYDNDVNRDMFNTQFESLSVKTDDIIHPETTLFSDFLFEFSKEFSTELGKTTPLFNRTEGKQIHNLRDALKFLAEKKPDNKRLNYYVSILLDRDSNDSFQNRIGNEEYKTISAEVFNIISGVGVGGTNPLKTAIDKINGIPTLNGLTMGRLEHEYTTEYGSYDNFNKKENYGDEIEKKRAARNQAELNFYESKELRINEEDFNSFKARFPDDIGNLTYEMILDYGESDVFYNLYDSSVNLPQKILEDKIKRMINTTEITEKIFYKYKTEKLDILQNITYEEYLSLENNEEITNILQDKIKEDKIKEDKNYILKLRETSKVQNKIKKVLTISSGNEGEEEYTTIKNFDLKNSGNTASIGYLVYDVYSPNTRKSNKQEITLEYSILEYINIKNSLSHSINVKSFLTENYYYDEKTEEEQEQIIKKFNQIYDVVKQGEKEKTVKKGEKKPTKQDININYVNPIMVTNIDTNEITAIHKPGEKYYMLYEFKRITEKYGINAKNYKEFKNSTKFNDANYTEEEFMHVINEETNSVIEYVNNDIEVAHFSNKDYLPAPIPFKASITKYEKLLYKEFVSISENSTYDEEKKEELIYDFLLTLSEKDKRELTTERKDNLIAFFDELTQEGKTISSIDRAGYFSVSKNKKRLKNGPIELDISKKNVSFSRILSETTLSNRYKMKNGDEYFINKKLGIHVKIEDLTKEQEQEIIEKLYNGNEEEFKNELALDLTNKNKRASYQDKFFKGQSKESDTYMINKMGLLDMPSILRKRKKVNFVGNKMKTNYDGVLEISAYSVEEIKALKEYIIEVLGKSDSDKRYKLYAVLDKLENPTTLNEKDEEIIIDGIKHGFIPDYSKESYLQYAGHYLEKIGLVTSRDENSLENPNSIRLTGQTAKVYEMKTKMFNEETGKTEDFVYELTHNDLKTVVENFDPTELVKKMFLNKVYSSFLQKTGRFKDIKETYKQTVSDSYDLFEFKRLNGSESYKEALSLINKNRSNMNKETIEKLNKIMASKDIGYITAEMNKILGNAENIQEEPNLEMSNRLLIINEKMSNFFNKYSQSSILNDTLKRFIAGSGNGSDNPEVIEEKDKIVSELLYSNNLKHKNNSFSEFDFIIYISSHLNDIVETAEYKSKSSIKDKMTYLRELYSEMVKYSTDKDIENLDTKMETFKDILQEETIAKHGKSSATDIGIFSNKTFEEESPKEVEAKKDTSSFNIKTHMESIMSEFPNQEIEDLLNTPNITVEEYKKISIKYLKKVVKKALNVDDDIKKKMKDILSLEKKASKEFEVTKSK
jgi:hypothetical protein